MNQNHCSMNSNSLGDNENRAEVEDCPNPHIRDNTPTICPFSGRIYGGQYPEIINTDQKKQCPRVECPAGRNMKPPTSGLCPVIGGYELNSYIENPGQERVCPLRNQFNWSVLPNPPCPFTMISRQVNENPNSHPTGFVNSAQWISNCPVFSVHPQTDRGASFQTCPISRLMKNDVSGTSQMKGTEQQPSTRLRTIRVPEINKEENYQLNVAVPHTGDASAFSSKVIWEQKMVILGLANKINSSSEETSLSNKISQIVQRIDQTSRKDKKKERVWLSEEFFSRYDNVVFDDSTKEHNEKVEEHVLFISQPIPPKEKTSSSKRTNPITLEIILEKDIQSALEFIEDRKNSQWIGDLVSGLDEEERLRLAAKFSDHLHELILKKSSCAILPRILVQGGQQRETFLRYVLDNVESLMDNPHANNVIKHFLSAEYGNWFTTEFLIMANMRFDELEHSFGFSQIVQHCLGFCKIEDLWAMTKFIKSNPAHILSGGYFKRCFIQILAKMPDKCKLRFFESIREHTLQLIICKFGNMFIQEMIKLRDSSINKTIEEVLTTNWATLLTKKYSKYVIVPYLIDNAHFLHFLAEKLLSYFSSESKY